MVGSDPDFSDEKSGSDPTLIQVADCWIIIYFIMRINMGKPLVLIILDGWGYNPNDEHNAINQANTPQWDEWWDNYPHTLLDASGCNVGLPDKQMGNSEVGHMHIGAGRTIAQDFTRINKEIDDGLFQLNPAVIDAIKDAKANKKAIHLMGLLSPGGVHSHEKHLFTLLQMIAAQNFHNTYVHAFLDGRDTPPQSAAASLERLQKVLEEYPAGEIKSITGRYYAMDRDNRWERIMPVYDLLTQSYAKQQANDPLTALNDYYQQGISDEFVPPTLIGQPQAMQDGDYVLFFNFRADRARQLSRALTDSDFTDFERDVIPDINLITMTQYAKNLDAHVAFPPPELRHTLGEVIASHGLSQLRLAETEKYAHVTFFFNGGNEHVFPNEDRILVPSPKVATYDLQPEMSAQLVTNALIDAIESSDYDVIICNYANADMVGHTGNFKATIQAIEALDNCFKRINQVVKKTGAELLFTADHGNAEYMYDENTGQAHTAHTCEPVPLLYVGRNSHVTKDMGSLIDLAPTLLSLLNIEVPSEMQGSVLIEIDN
jgi:2,3-bisphosphoglycerate-independent phosphoglycerate mutase